MDGKLVSGSLSAPEGSEHEGSLPFSTYTERFYEQFPYYLSIGMTPDQYWDGDPALVKYYRKADELKWERKNQELWLQGMYFYEAICDASPVLHAFAKKGTKLPSLISSLTVLQASFQALPEHWRSALIPSLRAKY